MVTPRSLLPPARSGNRLAGSQLVAERCGLVAERCGLVAERCGLVAERSGLVVTTSLVVGAASKHSSETSDDRS